MTAPSPEVQSTVAQGLGANAFGFVVTALVQVLSVPLFLHGFGVAVYGEWLVLTALPMYLTSSDLGFAGAASTRCTALVALKEFERARNTLFSTWFFVTLWCFGVVGLLCLLIAAFGLPTPIAAIQAHDAVIVVTLQLATVLVWIQGSFVEASLRADGQVGLGVGLFNAIRLGDLLAISATLAVKSTPVNVAMALLVLRVLATLLYALVAWRRVAWMHRAGWRPDASVIRSLASASLAYVSFALANGLGSQGLTVIIGVQGGAREVVVFSTARTVANVVRQSTGMVSLGLMPDMTRSLALRQVERTRRLFRLSMALSSAAAISALIVLSLLGPSAISVWTHGQVRVDRGFLVLMIATVAADVPWSMAGGMLVAANRHQRIGALYLFTTVITLVISAVVLPIAGLTAVPVVLLLLDFVLTPVAFRDLRAVLASPRPPDWSGVVVRPRG